MLEALPAFMGAGADIVLTDLAVEAAPRLRA
jgi:delta-aminolevulinic acid dehydratase/porphobilinogen synthase